MKNITRIGMMTVIGALLFAAQASAATTAILTPSTVKVAAGQQFNMAVSVNPQGTKNYAEKLEINYPTDLLQVVSFNLGPAWMALNQPGYDSLDNNSGVLIKTAGYAGGITSQTPFGTITFKAKKTGQAIVKFGSGSQAFEASSQTAVVGSNATVSVTEAVVPKVVAPKTVAPVTEQKSSAVEETETDLTPISSIGGEVIENQNVESQEAANQLAAVGDATSQSGSKLWLWIVLAVAALAVIGFGARAVVRK